MNRKLMLVKAANDVAIAYKSLAPDLSKVQVVDATDDAPGGYIEGYASIFGNVDLGGDQVEKGAFTKTLKERLKKMAVKFVDAHQVHGGTDAIVGVVVDAKEDDIGLWFRAKLSTVQRAQDVRTKIKEGILSALSFGYSTVKEFKDPKTGVNHLKELKLHEISIVPWGMNPLAHATTIKSVDADTDGAATGDEMEPEAMVAAVTAAHGHLQKGKKHMQSMLDHLNEAGADSAADGKADGPGDSTGAVDPSKMMDWLTKASGSVDAACKKLSPMMKQEAKSASEDEELATMLAGFEQQMKSVIPDPMGDLLSKITTDMDEVLGKGGPGSGRYPAGSQQSESEDHLRSLADKATKSAKEATAKAKASGSSEDHWNAAAAHDSAYDAHDKLLSKLSAGHALNAINLREHSRAASRHQLKAAQAASMGKSFTPGNFKTWDVTDNEIQYRVRDPEEFESGSFRTVPFKKDKPRVNSVMGKLTGKDTMTVQSLRFPKADDWTQASAEKWVKDNPDACKSVVLVEMYAELTDEEAGGEVSQLLASAQ